MMVIRPILLALTCLCFVGSVWAQHTQWKKLNNEVKELHAQGKYAEGAEMATQLLEAEEKAFGPTHPNVAVALINLAVFYMRLENYSDAEPLYKKALAILEKSQGPNHSDVAHALNHLAEFYVLQKKYSEAEPLYEKSLAIYEKARGPNHPDVAVVLLNLANLYSQREWYSEAEPLYKKSLAILEKSQGPNHSDVAHALNGLAEFYVLQKKYSEAEPLCKRSLAIYEKFGGPEHPSVPPTLGRLGQINRKLKKYSEAEAFCIRALELRKKMYKPESGYDYWLVGESLHDLAQVYADQGRYSEAEPLYKRSLAILETTIPGHPLLRWYLIDLAALYRAQGEHDKARELFSDELPSAGKGSAKEPTRVASVSQQPSQSLSVAIHDMKVNPSSVPGGARCTLTYEYTLEDAKGGKGKIPIETSYALRQDGTTLSEQPPVKSEVEKGKKLHTEKTLGTPRKSGSYELGVRIQCGETVAEKFVPFEIR